MCASTSVRSYCFVFDAVIEKLPQKNDIQINLGRPENNLKTVVLECLENEPLFLIDKAAQDKLLITMATYDYLEVFFRSKSW
ncbi:CmcI family methyltransferase [Polynucleobacter sp.]|uniref:CmcI family methyltransferase n=1 Tax=Polynucleobacter sp. TaxID=2029855 RepID=UPI003F69EF8B